jgi:predicted ATPase
LSSEKIVIAGGPSTGKTSVINAIEEKGFTCFHEISRQITLQARNEGIEQLFLTDPLLFSQRILEGRIHQFKQAQNHPDNIIFLDRGIHDVVAYLDCFETLYSEEFIAICNQYKYDKIFLLPPWREIHTADNERYENFEEAVKIHDCLEKTYTNFGYTVVDVPKLPIDERVAFILNSLNLL